MTTATAGGGAALQDQPICAWRPLASSPVRVVGPAALKPLMAYGGTVFDLREEGVSVEALPARLAGSGAGPDALILLLAAELGGSVQAAEALQHQGYSCVVVVNAGPAPDGAVPAETPG